MARSEDGERGEPARGQTSELFAADAEVGRNLAAVDWSATPLGPVAGWPQSLRTAVSILLSSRFSMWMAWGPRLTFFCNDAYRRDTLGRKYPWALGRPASEVWAEIWDDIGPRIDTVLTTGRATWDEALLLFLERSGYPEETYHTFSYSPLRDDDGAVVGMLCVVSEDTERVVGERRMATLRDLGSDPSVARTEGEVLAFAARQLGRNQHDLPFTLTYLFDEDGRLDGGAARLAMTSGITAGSPAAPLVLPAQGQSLWPAETLSRGEPALVSLDGPLAAGLPAGPWPQPPTHALLAPLPRQGGAPYGFLVAGVNRHRPLDEGYRGFVDLVAGHVAAGVAGARGYQAQQQRAEQLAELDRAKTTFFSNISHELRTPLTLIMGPVDELRARLAGADEGVREELEVIRRNALRLSKLVNTLLDFSRIEAGRMAARFQPVDLSEVTAELASVFRSAIERAGLTLEVDCPPLPEPVWLDQSMWEKVLLNLLSNALKFTFHGAIRVTVSAEPDQAVVTVADTGVGVPEQEIPRLFERFHRVENTRARSNEGSGIGLALVKELVALHGGTIAARSHEGEGATFTIRLPFGVAHVPPDARADGDSAVPVSAAAAPYIHEALRWLPATATAVTSAEASEQAAQPQPPSPDDTSGVEAPGGRSASVLVADDNADMREYLARLLAGAGHTVRTVPDGQAALEAVRADPPDLVVADVMMPRLDGLRLLSALRAEPRTAALPVLLLSARAGQEASIEGLEAGADDYLVKPFAAADLLARVRANVELARLRGHHARWRAALVESLQEAFFVCDENGVVTEINSAFTDILGYGPEGLPYGPNPPWWPDPDSDPQAYQQVAAAHAQLVGSERGACVIPVTRRDGGRVWVSANFSHVQDPATGRHAVVGTFRDVTAEHYAIQRESALAAVSTRMARADNMDDALDGALAELRELWHAERALAVVFGADAPPRLSGTDPKLSWDTLDDGRRATLRAIATDPLSPPREPPSPGVRLDHPHGPMALWLDIGGRRPFTEQDDTLLALLAGHIAQGLARSHQEDQQREAALALQRAILGPAHLPDGFAVRYEPASRPLEVGGDWYDTIALPDRKIGIVVGDCVGRGLKAATVMGQLRSACRALLLRDPRPEQALTALDRFAEDVPGAFCTTVFCGVLETDTGTLTYCSAGHPPGILVHPDGTVRLLDEGRSAPLAVRTPTPRASARHVMPPRATLLLYTDGLIERRRQSLTVGLAEAGQAVQDGRDVEVEELASRLMAHLAPADGYDDDVALLLYRHPGPLDISFRAEAGQLAPVREALRGWLGQCGLPRQIAQSILVAAGEACANAIEHGHRDTPDDAIRLRAEALVDHLSLTVADTGRWLPPQPQPNDHRGRGLALMRAMMQDVTITPGPAGTVVKMHVRIA